MLLYLLMLFLQVETSAKTVKTPKGETGVGGFSAYVSFLGAFLPQETRIWTGGLVHDFQEASVTTGYSVFGRWQLAFWS